MISDTKLDKLRTFIELKIKQSECKNPIELEQTRKDIESIIENRLIDGENGENLKSEALKILRNTVSKIAAEYGNDGELHDIFNAKSNEQKVRTPELEAPITKVNQAADPNSVNNLTSSRLLLWGPATALFLCLVALSAAVLGSPGKKTHGGSVLEFLGYATNSAVETHVQFLTTAQRSLGAFVDEFEVYPVSGEKFIPIVTAFNFMKEKGIKTPTLTASNSDKLMYRSDGLSFKLVYIGSGLCSAVKLEDPSLVDPARSFNNKDCFGYGVWTDKAKTW